MSSPDDIYEDLTYSLARIWCENINFATNLFNNYNDKTCSIMNIEEITTADLPGVSPGIAESLKEGAVVCLSRHNHQSGVSLDCEGVFKGQEAVTWTTAYTDQMNRAWNDQEVATEHGAVCISILHALQRTPYTIVERSRKTSGIDYWLGMKGDPLFTNVARLEVSGIFDGQDNVKSRVNFKLKQSNQSDSTGLPAYISVVEFSKPTINFVQK